MKKLILFAAIITLCTSFILVKRLNHSNSDAKYTIGILQTASHPALDAVRDGFIETLKSKMGHDVEFVIQNAQGSISQAHAIAQQFHANKKFTGFFAIATPAAQALSAVEQQRPIVISAVTDPNNLGLIHPRTNVCGINDLIDVKAEIEMLIQLLPQAKTIGLLYTSGEANSIALVKQMRAELEHRGLQPIDFAISSEADIHAIVELASRKSDVILAPTDNTVASAIDLIASIALKHKRPLIVSDNMLVKAGALAARGVDYKVSGNRAGDIAYEVLALNKKPYALPIEQAKSEQVFINKATLQALGITIPNDLLKTVVLV